MRPLRVLTSLAALLIASGAVASADQGERKIGQRVYDQLAKQGKIVHGTAYNRVLDPIAKRLGEAARGLYDEPFQFYVIHDKTLNAFAVPGGFMFVHDGLIDAVRTKEELAGVMCHEMSHVIHHDGVHAQARANTVGALLTVASIFAHAPLARTAVDVADYGAQFGFLHYSRHLETAADLTGADVCAKAGYNPYGLVWTMETLQAQAGTQPLEMLSNHPRDDHRVSDLLDHFKADPQTFARFTDDETHATPVYAKRDDVAPMPYAQQWCPHGTKPGDDPKPALSWLGRTAPWPSSAAIGTPSTRVANDAIALGQDPKTSWFRAADALGGIAVAFDDTTHATLSCEETESATHLAVVGASYPPPFKAAQTPLAQAHTGAGIALMSSLADVVRLYGNATPQRDADGTSVYRYATSDAAGAGAAEWFRIRDNAVIAFGRDTTY